MPTLIAILSSLTQLSRMLLPTTIAFWGCWRRYDNSIQFFKYRSRGWRSKFNIDLQCIANNLLSDQFTKANGLIRITAANYDKEGDHSIAVANGSCSCSTYCKHALVYRNQHDKNWYGPEFANQSLWFTCKTKKRSRTATLDQ